MAGKNAWFAAAVVGLALVGLAFGTVLTRPTEVDFISFWMASRLIVGGEAAAAYAFQPSDLGNLMPLAYPPPFLFVIAPLSLVPLGLSFILWVTGTGLLYLLAARAPKWVALGNPAAVSNAMVGQNGFLTAGIMLAGLHALARNPPLGGAILGLMIVKPHLAALLPIAVIAGRKWAAIPAAILSSAALLLLAALAFGPGIYAEFLDAADFYQGLVVTDRWRDEHASIFAFVRWFGLGDIVAWAAHVCVAIAAGVAVWLAWREDSEAKIALTAAASLLVSPYQFTYDAVLLVAPLAWLSARRPAWALAVFVLAAVPLVRSFVLFESPNTIALAAAASVLGMFLAARAGSAQA